ncbi:hypothetical protein DMO17_18630 [Aquipseudomonas alcaligenes]|uniref:Bacterial type II secretion system protein E domain-containing protein n=1 Tax=Aquipseudomonas alcaligenes TaxID=43263 RepID=A0A2V4KQH5_AQUAC|nr:ATPase, T2SS/T4P/T4SS family [Pseudomonas alcaligenes]PYC20214.1 hypothetical protein DMO17_18630 [Pseudomonas alcaligenes]
MNSPLPRNNKEEVATLQRILLDQHVLSPEQVEQLNEYLRYDSRNLADIIVSLEMAPEIEVIRAMAQGLGEIHGVQETVNIDSRTIEYLANNGMQLSARVSFERDQVTVGRVGSSVLVATSNVTSASNISATRLFFGAMGLDVRFIATTHMMLTRLQQSVYGKGGSLREQIHTIIADREIFNRRIYHVVCLLVELAMLERASDIFIMLGLNDELSSVYFKVGQVKRFALAAPTWAIESISKAIKLDAGMDSGRYIGHDDGALLVPIFRGRYRVNLRVSSITTVSGQQLTLRLQNESSASRTLVELGFSEQDAERLKRAVMTKQGLVVLSGSTGSGKTTTLYTLLNFFDVDRYNIITMEDPVEIRRRGINQIQINDRAGQSFQDSIRSCLRQAPDILLVGEVRDRETAERAVEAANTGHLVLCTIHANGVHKIQDRLAELGVLNAQAFMNNLTVAIHQALLPAAHGVRLDYQLLINH